MSDDEVRILRSKNGSLIDPNNLPITWQAMRELWVRQADEDELTEDEVEFLSVFEKLPVPYGLLEEHERSGSFVGKLDHIWRAMEVASAGRAEILLEMDGKKYVRSQGVSTIPREERHYQQYQLFEAWSRLMLPCLPGDISRCMSVSDPVLRSSHTLRV